MTYHNNDKKDAQASKLSEISAIKTLMVKFEFSIVLIKYHIFSSSVVKCQITMR